MKNFEGTVTGILRSKANSRVLRVINGRYVPIKSRDAQLFQADAIIQLQALYGGRKPISGDLVLEATVFYPNRRSDLDISLFEDILQRAEIIENDRQFKELHLYHGLDKDNPRVEFAIWQMENN